MRTRLRYITLGIVTGLICNAAIVLAWTGPTASPPGNNVAAPVNVGTTAQVKNGDVGVNNLSAFGNELLSGLGVGTGRYLNFDYTSGGTSGTGAAGYGIWDNNGVLNFKNAGGSWQTLQALVASGGSQWTTGTGGTIYYNGGNVGVGTVSPGAKLQVNADSGQTGLIINTTSAAANTAPAAITYKNNLGNQIFYEYPDYAGSFRIERPGSTNDFVISSGGKVGIGVASPAYKLDVAGGGNFTGGVTSVNAGGRGISAAGNSANWSGCFGSDCTGSAQTQYGVYGNGTVWAGQFSGNVYVSGYVQATNSFGGLFGTIVETGSCNWPNPLTGGCSCPGYAPYAAQADIGYHGSGYSYLYQCY